MLAEIDSQHFTAAIQISLTIGGSAHAFHGEQAARRDARH
jgi:hypothetical protein